MPNEIKQISETFLKDLSLLLKTAEQKLPQMNLLWHSESVARYSKLAYEYLPEYEKKTWLIRNTMIPIPSDWIYTCGYYHDIGKAIILKLHEGMLEKESFDDYDKMNIKEHTSFGSIILQVIATASGQLTDIDTPIFGMMNDACLYHHERMDGTGYMKMEGVHIPKISGLIAVADCFSAGVETRPYKEHKLTEDMFKELKEMPLNQVYVNALEKGIKEKSNIPE